MALSKTPMGQVRGHGSALAGTQAFWRQRLTAVALIPLSILFVAFMLALTGAEHMVASVLIGEPLVAIIMLMFVLTGFYHLQLGMTHIVEDYIHWKWGKFALIVAVNLGCLALAISCVLSILKLSLGSAM